MSVRTRGLDGIDEGRVGSVGHQGEVRLHLLDDCEGKRRVNNEEMTCQH